MIEAYLGTGAAGAAGDAPTGAVSDGPDGTGVDASNDQPVASAPLLELKDIDVYYGGIQAVEGVSHRPSTRARS